MRVFDASAILAMVFNEPGADKVQALLQGGAASISAVNLAEIVARLVERGFALDHVDAICAGLRIEVVPLDEATAQRSGKLRAATRAMGLSLGDRCCLALAQSLNAEVVTADRPWKALKGFRFTFIR